MDSNFAALMDSEISGDYMEIAIHEELVGAMGALWTTLLPTSLTPLFQQQEKRQLKSTFHNMIRRIAGSARSPEEPWLDWIKRSTRTACREAKLVISASGFGSKGISATSSDGLDMLCAWILLALPGALQNGVTMSGGRRRSRHLHT